MTDLLIPDFEDDVRDSLRRRAERHGRSMEEEVRDILRAAAVASANDEPPDLGPLGTKIIRMFEGIGLTEDIPEIREPVRFIEFDP